MIQFLRTIYIKKYESPIISSSCFTPSLCPGTQTAINQAPSVFCTGYLVWFSLIFFSECAAGKKVTDVSLRRRHFTSHFHWGYKLKKEKEKLRAREKEEEFHRFAWADWSYVCVRSSFAFLNDNLLFSLRFFDGFNALIRLNIKTHDVIEARFSNSMPARDMPND